MNLISVKHNIRFQLKEKKYAIILGNEFSVSPLLKAAQQQLWDAWNTLKPDNYLRGGAGFRLRRFGLFYLHPDDGEVLPLPQTTYQQAIEVNTYAGGIERAFEALSETTISNQFLHALIKFNFRQFPVDSQKATHAWEVDVHQFRIIATHEEPGEPTPEGLHHDGDDFNCIHLIDRQNAAGGVSTICDNDRAILESHTLLEPMDTIMVWDPHVMHGVTPIYLEDPNEPAIRDALVIGYNYRPNLKQPG